MLLLLLLWMLFILMAVFCGLNMCSTKHCQGFSFVVIHPMELAKTGIQDWIFEFSPQKSTLKKVWKFQTISASKAWKSKKISKLKNLKSTKAGMARRARNNPKDRKARKARKIQKARKTWKAWKARKA